MSQALATHETTVRPLSGKPLLLQSFSARLIAKLDLAFDAVRYEAAALWCGEHARAAYPVYLQFMAAVVKAAVPLMEAAMDASQKRLHMGGLSAEQQRNYQQLIAYLAVHKEEERGHDGWLAEDLLETGVAGLTITDRCHEPCVATLVGAQYYWIQHVDPISILGHITALENYHPPEGFAQYLSQQTGYPLTAFRAIARHEKLDLVHKKELCAQLDALHLDPAQQRLITLSGLHTMQAGQAVLTRCYTLHT